MGLRYVPLAQRTLPALIDRTGVWPAWWTVGGGTWPWVGRVLFAARLTDVLTLLPACQTGEIDIIEGVHDNEHNQVTWHTGPSMYTYAVISAHASLITFHA